MHKIYVTDGIVLAKRGAGEANSVVVVLTAELGLLRAAARSSRFEKSKLRYGLEPLTRGRFSFVQGKREWRLVGVESVSRSYLATSTEVRQAYGRITKLLLRLLAGEEPVAALYQTVVGGFDALSEQNILEKSPELVEIILVLRILAHLGYLPQRAELAPFVDGTLLSADLAAQAAASRAVLIKTINESLSATGL